MTPSRLAPSTGGANAGSSQACAGAGAPVVRQRLGEESKHHAPPLSLRQSPVAQVSVLLRVFCERTPFTGCDLRGHKKYPVTRTWLCHPASGGPCRATVAVAEPGHDLPRPWWCGCRL